MIDLNKHDERIKELEDQLMANQWKIFKGVGVIILSLVLLLTIVSVL